MQWELGRLSPSVLFHNYHTHQAHEVQQNQRALYISSEASLGLLYLPSVDREIVRVDRCDPDHKHIINPVIVLVPCLKHDACFDAVPDVSRLRWALRAGEDVDVVGGAELVDGVHRELALGVDKAPVSPDGEDVSCRQGSQLFDQAETAAFSYSD